MSKFRRHIGKWIFYLGFRILPLRIRRGVSLLISVGVLWTKENDEILIRVMNGEHIDLAIGFKTIEAVESE